MEIDLVCQRNFDHKIWGVVSIPAFIRAGKAVIQIAAVEITNDFLKIGSVEPVLMFKPILLDLDKNFKVVHHAPVIIRRLEVPEVIKIKPAPHPEPILPRWNT